MVGDGKSHFDVAESLVCSSEKQGKTKRHREKAREKEEGRKKGRKGASQGDKETKGGGREK